MAGVSGNGMEEQEEEGGGDGTFLRVSLHSSDFWSQLSISHAQNTEMKSRMGGKSLFAQNA